VLDRIARYTSFEFAYDTRANVNRDERVEFSKRAQGCLSPWICGRRRWRAADGAKSGEVGETQQTRSARFPRDAHVSTARKQRKRCVLHTKQGKRQVLHDELILR